MTSSSVLILAIFTIVAQCYVLKDKDSGTTKPENSREKRSCYVCEYGYGPPPPPPSPHGFGAFGPHPPPRYFHARNWNGNSRNTDGSQGLFSGASAAAMSRADIRGTSVASSSANADTGNQMPGDGSTTGSQSDANAQFQSGRGRNNVSFNDQNNVPQNSENNGFGVERGTNSRSSSESKASGSGSLFFGNNQQQEQSTYGGFGSWRGHGLRPEKYQNAKPLRGDNEQQFQSSGGGQWEHSGYGSGGKFSTSQSESASGALHGAGFGGSDGGRGGAGSAREALRGALDLGSQGLQAAQQSTDTGCSTCNKGSYALSNAKSDSGDAIAVSIGR